MAPLGVEARPSAVFLGPAHRSVATTNNWSEHAENALVDQQPPITKLDLHALETSIIDWAKFKSDKAPALKAKKSLRPHQKNACDAVRTGLAQADRGKLIMACGTGKTFTSLKIAEDLAGAGGHVLFLVPSLALLSQTLTEWTQESTTPLQSFAVCSDSDVGKKRGKTDDAVQTLVHELQYPATTDAKHLAREVDERADKKHMTVVFGTYHSIDVVSRAQKKHGLPPFDLIICDEAHRTTGAKFEGRGREPLHQGARQQDRERQKARVHDLDAAHLRERRQGEGRDRQRHVMLDGRSCDVRRVAVHAHVLGSGQA